MGAAESTAAAASPRLPPSSPRQDPSTLPQFRPDRPLHTLLHPSSSPLPLPSDPDHEIWPVLFSDYAAVDAVSATALTPLAAYVLSSRPSAPHIRALATAVRAATFRLRAHCAAVAAASPSAFAASEILGALLFARAVLRALRARAASHDQLAEALGALDGAADMPRADRIDIGHSVLWQLIASALDFLVQRSSGTASSPVLRAAVELVFVALSDELYGDKPHSAVEREDLLDRERSECTLSAIVDRYSRPGDLVCALLDILSDAAPHADTTKLLANGGEAGANANPSAINVSRASAIALVAPGIPFPQGGMGLGMAALAATASGFNFQTGFSDALSVISSRLPLRGFLSTSSEAESPTSGKTQMTVPDVDPDPYARYPVDATRITVDTYGRGSESPRVNGGAPSPRLGSATQSLLARSDAANGPPAPIPSSPGSARSRAGTGATTIRSPPGSPVVPMDPLTTAELSLALLCLLCGPRPLSPFRKALFSLQDIPKKAENGTAAYSFAKLYESLGKWMAHPRAALLAYYLISGNRRFRTFTLARTDPDVLLIPLLASLRRRCVIGSVAGDAYIPASILVMLTSDKGFCEAIDMINVHNSWLTFIEDKSRLGNEKISLSGIILLVCARVVQQSLVLRRRMPECFLAGLCLAIMANVSGDATSVHSLTAERLLSLVEFLGRRRKKAIILTSHREEMPSVPPRISDSPRAQGRKGPSLEALMEADPYLAANAKLSLFETSRTFLDQLSDFLGLALEIIVSALRSRSVVSANRHLVYTLLHREAILDSEHVAKASVKCEALTHVLRRVINFFGAQIDGSGEPWSNSSKRRSFDQNSAGSSGISVERVFEVIDKNARHLPSDIFEGLPSLRFNYEESEGSDEFVRVYSWSLATRSSDFFWDLSKASLPVQNSPFLPSK